MIVKCTFFDHYQADMQTLQQPAVCVVYGVLVKEDDLAYYIASWVCDGEYESHNTDGYCILKSTVTELIELKESRHEAKNAVGHKGSTKHVKSTGKAVEPGSFGGTGGL